MKKKALAAVLAAAMTLSLTGAATTVYAGEKAKVEMTVWSGEWGDQLDRIMENFNSTHEDVELNITMQSGDYSDFLGTAAATNDWPDIFILTPWAQVQTFAETGRIADLSDMAFVDKVYPTALDAAKYEDKVYAYPANTEYLGVFYNKDMFAEAGIEKAPTTRDEFADACAKLEEAGMKPIAPAWKESWTLKHLFSVLVSNAVQDDMSGFLDSLNSGEGTFDVEGMDDVFACADVIKQYSGSNAMDCDSTSAFNALANGEAAMALTGEFSQNVVGAMDNPPDIGYFALPVSNDAARNKAAVDVGIVYAVSANTENMDACKQVIDYLSDPDDEDGYFSIVCEKPGSAPPAMEWNGGIANSSSEDYAEYANSGNVIPWVYQQYVNGFDVISGDIFQGYMADAYSRDDAISQLNDAYLQYLDQ